MIPPVISNATSFAVINSNVEYLNKCYERILDDLYKTNIYKNGNYQDQPSPKIEALAGSVDLVLQYVFESIVERPSLFGRVVFVYADPISGDKVPVHAIQFGTDGTVYTSDERTAVYDSGFNGRLINEYSVNQLVLAINAAIVCHHTRQLSE